jgi:hypothetical protein
MIQVEVHRFTGSSLDEVFEQVARELSGGPKAKYPGVGKGMLGLDRRPDDKIARNRAPGRYKWEPSTPGGKPADEATLLTLRRDLTSLREKVLKGVGRRAALRELDYTIDQLDNVLGEM